MGNLDLRIQNHKPNVKRGNGTLKMAVTNPILSLYSVNSFLITSTLFATILKSSKELDYERLTSNYVTSHLEITS
jgi:hypothetical protein